jgi:hypothetical protein
LLWHTADWLLALARESAGSNMPAKTAMIAMTTNSSMSVKAERRIIFPSVIRKVLERSSATELAVRQA